MPGQTGDGWAADATTAPTRSRPGCQCRGAPWPWSGPPSLVVRPSQDQRAQVAEEGDERDRQVPHLTRPEGEAQAGRAHHGWDPEPGEPAALLRPLELLGGEGERDDAGGTPPSHATIVRLLRAQFQTPKGPRFRPGADGPVAAPARPAALTAGPVFGLLRRA